MTHRVEIYTTDISGKLDVIGANYYCSDSCAKLDPEYQGWNGAVDCFSPVQCPCGRLLSWFRWNYELHDEEIVLSTALDYWETY